MSIGDEIARLCAEHDRLKAEREEWIARREAAAASPVQKSGDRDILYRTNANGAQASAAAQNGAQSNADGSLFGDWRDEALSKAVGIAIADTREKMRAALAARDAKISKLETQIEMLIGLLGKSANFADLKSGDVIELPKGFLRRVHNAA